MTKASDNDYPSVLVTEQGSAPSSPAASHQRLYIRTSDHHLVRVNSSGTVTDVEAGSSGIPATIIDAKGDLIGGTAADTAGRLAVGANGTRLIADSAQTTGLAWAAFSGCRVRSVADVSLTSGSVVYITWDTEDYDTDAFHSTVTNTSRLTIPTGGDGTYLIGAHGFTSATPGNSYSVIRLNGTTIIAGGPLTNDGGAGAGMLVTPYVLAATNYVEYGVKVGAGSKSWIDAGVVDGAFWLHKLS